ncbi:MAG: hypothetical protein M0P61_04190 [Ignavibacteriaceae bacterium]|nr:hypothetical protein [Ignavibacteriaceae bacterium]
MIQKILKDSDRYFFIGTTILSVKVVLVIAAYLLNGVQFNAFSQYYYTASLILLFASFGFDFPFARVGFRVEVLSGLLFVHTILASFILYFGGGNTQNLSTTFSFIVYSFFTALGGIVSFRMLFKGDYRRYFVIIVLQTLLLFGGLLFYRYTNRNLSWVIPITASIWGLTTVYLFNEKGNAPSVSIKEFYSASISSFIINSAVSLGLLADKYVATHYFTLETANAYTFAWGVTAPLFYIGNFIERVLYSYSSLNKKKIYSMAIILHAALLLLYFVLVIELMTGYTRLLPGFVQLPIFKDIFWKMFSVYSIFTLLHFALNAFLFKLVPFAVQKLIAGIYLGWVVTAGAFALFFFNEIKGSYNVVLIAMLVYIYVLLGIKGGVLLFVYRGKKGLLKRGEEWN